MSASVNHYEPFTLYANDAEAYYDSGTGLITLHVSIAQNPDRKLSSDHCWGYESRQFNLNSVLGYHDGK